MSLPLFLVAVLVIAVVMLLGSMLLYFFLIAILASTFVAFLRGRLLADLVFVLFLFLVLMQLVYGLLLTWLTDVMTVTVVAKACTCAENCKCYEA